MLHGVHQGSAAETLLLGIIHTSKYPSQQSWNELRIAMRRIAVGRIIMGMVAKGSIPMEKIAMTGIGEANNGGIERQGEGERASPQRFFKLGV